MKSRESKKLNDLEILTIESNDSGVGFLVKVDGLTIFHPGDHANRKEDFSGTFKGEIDYLTSKTKNVDIAFLPVTGCSFNNPAALKKGTVYINERLKPKFIFPMHGGRNEHLYKEFVQDMKEKINSSKFICAETRGDRFFYSKGKIK